MQERKDKFAPFQSPNEDQKWFSKNKKNALSNVLKTSPRGTQKKDHQYREGINSQGDLNHTIFPKGKPAVPLRYLVIF